MKYDSKLLHAGWDSDADSEGSITVPIYKTTAYQFNNTEHAANLFGLKEFGNIYSRLGNPTVGALEARLTALEGGAMSVALASGTSAVMYSLINIMSQGDNFVTASQLYGGTYTMFDNILPEYGINAKKVDITDLKAVEDNIDNKTRAIYCETVTNPGLVVADVTALSDIAHKHGIPLIVDNTVATPYLCRPIDFGADIVIHSLTKYIDGHGATIGGIIVDSGKFDWAKEPKKYPMLNEPDPSYHGVVYTKTFGPAAFIGCCRVVPLRETGACLSPNNAYIIMLGLESLGVRMERHCENALALAKYLENHDRVEWVNYAALPNDKYNDVCKKITNGQASGIISFGIKGGKDAGAKFIDALQMILRVLSMGDAKSLACHPASTLHRQLTSEQKALAGVSEDLVRISVGIEHIDDIIQDVEQAIEASKK